MDSRGSRRRSSQRKPASRGGRSRSNYRLNLGLRAPGRRWSKRGAADHFSRWRPANCPRCHHKPGVRLRIESNHARGAGDHARTRRRGPCRRDGKHVARALLRRRRTLGHAHGQHATRRRHVSRRLQRSALRTADGPNRGEARTTV